MPDPEPDIIKRNCSFHRLLEGECCTAKKKKRGRERERRTHLMFLASLHCNPLPLDLPSFSISAPPPSSSLLPPSSLSLFHLFLLALSLHLSLSTFLQRRLAPALCSLYLLLCISSLNSSLIKSLCNKTIPIQTEPHGPSLWPVPFLLSLSFSSQRGCKWSREPEEGGWCSSCQSGGSPCCSVLQHSSCSGEPSVAAVVTCSQRG